MSAGTRALYSDDSPPFSLNESNPWSNRIVALVPGGSVDVPRNRAFLRDLEVLGPDAEVALHEIVPVGCWAMALDESSERVRRRQEPRTWQIIRRLLELSAEPEKRLLSPAPDDEPILHQEKALDVVQRQPQRLVSPHRRGVRAVPEPIFSNLVMGMGQANPRAFGRTNLGAPVRPISAMGSAAGELSDRVAEPATPKPTNPPS